MPAITWREKLDAHKATMQGIVDKAKAEHRDLTHAEADDIERLAAEASDYKRKAERAEAAQARVDDLAGRTNPQGKTKVRHDPLSVAFFDHVGAQVHEPEPGRKALVPSGGLTVPVDVGAVAAARPEFSIAPLLAPGELTGPTFAYLRQVTRTNNAAAVAVGGLKPTSVYQLQQITGEAVTVAHLTEPIPRQYIADVASLQRFLSDELSYGLQREVDRLILEGSGTPPEFEGILSTTGVRSQPFDTNALDSIRSAFTLLATAGETPTAVVMSPQDWQDVETLRDAEGRYLLPGGPGQPADKSLWGVPVVLNLDLAQGSALVGDFRMATLLTREGIRIDWSESVGESFQRNQIVFRAETRVGLAITRPGAFATVDLTAA